MTIPWALFMTGLVLVIAGLLAFTIKLAARTSGGERAWEWAATLAFSLGFGFMISGIWVGVAA